jgi:hypothetical protein
MGDLAGSAVHHEPWNKGKIVGQKAPFKLKDIGAQRPRLRREVIDDPDIGQRQRRALGRRQWPARDFDRSASHRSIQ